MSTEKLKEWRLLQEKYFSPSELEFMLKLYGYGDIRIDEKITGNHVQNFNRGRQVPAETKLLKMGLIEKIEGTINEYKLTYMGLQKMDDIESLVSKNTIQRLLLKLNKYPVAITLVSAIIGALITLMGGLVL